MYRAVLDTCVLVPSLQRDFLLQLAAEEAFAPLWGTGILTELDYVLARLHERRHVMDSDVRRRHLLDQMRRAFPGSEVNAPKDREYHYELSDPEDGHVAHAALLGKADAIVTDDTRAGFTTATVLTEANIEIVSPHEFAVNTISAHPEAEVRALRVMSKRHTDPIHTADGILDLLVERYAMADAADILPALASEQGKE